ncbi:MAG: SGNH/GDSL hydrolase family protein [Firmicutes bacterium]|nr:SGNH/GDSL hydrolase family protein [Bacillota bacterium]
MIYLALGDSITHGYEASSDDRRYVDVLTQKLAGVQRTHAYVHAKPGWTSGQLLRSLDRIPLCILCEAELVSLMIGGNDLLKELPWFLDDPDEGVQRLERSFRPRVEEILRTAVRNPAAKVIVCTVYNPFPKAELAQRAIAGINGILADIARERGAWLAPVHERYGGQEDRLVHRFKRGELQDFRLHNNPIHPNDAGHERIAEVIFQTWRRAVRSSSGPTGKRKTQTRTGSAHRARLSRDRSV